MHSGMGLPLYFTLHNVEDEEKVFHLCRDGEKLASIAWLIKTAPGAALSLNKKKSVGL
jgi:hypothetical protein